MNEAAFAELEFRLEVRCEDYSLKFKILIRVIGLSMHYLNSSGLNVSIILASDQKISLFPLMALT
jgi:hypothetical protein